MAAPTWKYPDTTSPTTTLEFPRGHFFDDDRYPSANQDIEETETREIMTTSHGDDIYEQTFTCQVPTATQSGDTVDVDKLTTFVTTTIGWALRAFYYTDSSGTSYRVKLLTNNLKPSKKYVNYNEYTFTLREV